MPMTPYSSANHEFSNKAHQQARIDIYPLLFDVPAERLSFPVPPDAQERDFHQAIDRNIKIAVPGLRGDLCITVQERFREPKYAHYQDTTITEFNHVSGMLGELYKIEAELMLYAYFNEHISRFIEAIGFWVAPLKVNIAQSNIQQSLEHNYRSHQDFFCFKFEELETLPGVVVFRKRWNEQGILPRPSDNNYTYKKAKKTVKQTFEQTIRTTEIIEEQASYWQRHLDWDEEEQA